MNYHNSQRAVSPAPLLKLFFFFVFVFLEVRCALKSVENQSSFSTTLHLRKYAATLNYPCKTLLSVDCKSFRSLNFRNLNCNLS